MSKQVYVALVRRVIHDELELQIQVTGNIDPAEIERKAEEMAAKLPQFDPSAMTTTVKTSLVALDLVQAEPAKDQLKLKL